MMEPMQAPMTRAEFERRFHLLSEVMKQERFHVPRGMTRTTSGIQKVRYLPNGRIDFLSVDELARLNANMMSQFSDGAFNDMIEDNGATKNK